MSNLILSKTLGQPLNLFHWSTEGLVFYWRGIQAEKVWDESLFGNHGTITGATWVGESLYFNGSDQYTSHEVGAGFISVLPVTVTCWVKAENDNPAANEYFFYFGDASSIANWLSLSFTTAGKIRLWARDAASQIITDNDYADGQWHFVVGQYYDNDSQFVRIFVDGTLQGAPSSGPNPTAISTFNRFAFGMLRDNTPSAPFTGWIKNASIYNRLLSASEISALYLNPALPMQQPPIWLFTPPPVVGAVPKGPLGHPLYGPFAGPIAC